MDFMGSSGNQYETNQQDLAEVIIDNIWYFLN